ncbi:MAG: DUF4143 domain-containing protein [Planctomycetota bacterium]
MIQRQLDLWRILGETRSAFLFGPRGVGKTYLAQRFLEASGGGLAINLLNLDVYRRYVTDLTLFRREVEHAIGDGTLTVLVDEVQKFPALLDEVHGLIEAHKPKVRFLLTGSSARKLRRGGANLLAGRAWTLMLHPLSSSEVDLDLQRALSFGSLPAIYLEDSSPVRSLTAYVDTYLREEILVEALVRKSESFIRFLDLAGQINGEPVNHAKLGRAAGVSSKTVQEYFSILVDTLVALRVDGWSHSIRKQLRQSPKYYFFDCGVLNAIRGEIRSELRPHTYRYGKLFETLVVNEVQRRNDYEDLGYRLYYWRTNSGREVDLILARGPADPPCAIEIKSDSAPTEADMRGLRSFRSENPTAKLFCFCTTPRAYRFGDVKVVPWQDGLREI